MKEKLQLIGVWIIVVLMFAITYQLDQIINALKSLLTL